MDLIISHALGLYCPLGDFFIDPWRPVERALITHGHSDHARFGNAHYLCHHDSVPILKKRLGDVDVQGVAYGETQHIDGVAVSFHPAGHVLGSAQIRVEHRGEVWVASGDYKLESDGTCPPFELQRCHAFITECTFGLPVYRWRPQSEVMGQINDWWRENAAAGRASVVGAYALGKAQRILRHLDPSLGPIICHGAVTPINDIYRARGVSLPQTRRISEVDRTEMTHALIIAPPSAIRSAWTKRFGDFSDAFASGWMQIRGNRRRRGVDHGFVLSDHVDWPGLVETIAGTSAERVFATHGGVETLTRYLRDKGVDARTLSTEYGDEALEGDVAASDDA